MAFPYGTIVIVKISGTVVKAFHNTVEIKSIQLGHSDSW